MRSSGPSATARPARSALVSTVTRPATRSTGSDSREPAIEVTKDGPYRITGGIRLTSQQSEPVKRAEGASLEHYALCRCGHSQNKPFCSGMHWYVDFKRSGSRLGRNSDVVRMGRRTARR